MFTSIPAMLIFTIVTVMIAVGLHYFVGRAVLRMKLAGHNDVAVGVYATISVVYAVVIGLLVVIGQERRDSASSSMVLEAAILDDLTHASAAFGKETSNLMHRSVIAYTETVIGTEWDLLMSDRDEDVSNKPYENLWKDVLTIEPADQRQNIVYGTLVSRLEQLASARYARINAASDHLTVFLWIVLLSGGVILVMFPWLFSVANSTVHLMMTGVMTLVVTLVLLLVLAYDNPLAGVIALDQQPYEALLQDIRSDH